MRLQGMHNLWRTTQDRLLQGWCVSSSDVGICQCIFIVTQIFDSTFAYVKVETVGCEHMLGWLGNAAAIEDTFQRGNFMGYMVGNGFLHTVMPALEPDLDAP